MSDTPAKPITFYRCGPRTDCDAHEWSGDDMVPIEGGGYSAYCVRCGTLAIDEALWE